MKKLDPKLVKHIKKQILEPNPFRRKKKKKKLNSLEMKFLNQQNQEEIRPLVIGDVIYLKFETEFETKNTNDKNSTYKYKGYLGGDGLAVNWMRCYPSEACRFKTLGRFLFEVVPFVDSRKKERGDEVSKKIAKEELSVKNQNLENQNVLLRKKNNLADKKREKTMKIHQRDTTLSMSIIDESQNLKDERLISEQEQNLKKRIRKTKYQKKTLKRGDPLLYEETICLKHIYSETYVKINQLKLAKENNCVKVSLISKMTKECKLNFLDPSNTKKKGEAVYSNDTVSLNFVGTDYVVRVEERLLRFNRLVVNAGKTLCMFKIYNYNKSSVFNENSTSTLRNGDIIKFYNKETDRYLGTRYNPLNFKKEKTSVYFTGGDSLKYFSEEMDFKIDFLSQERHRNRHKKTVIPHDSEKNIITTLWEVRLLGSMTNEPVKNSNEDEACVLLKNVITGDFLYCEDGILSVRKLITAGDKIKNFMFYLKMKNSWTNNNSIKFHSLITIREGVNKDLITFYEKDTLKYEIRVSNSQINSFPFFELQNCGHEKRIAFKIKDINKSITNFCRFIQNFGIEKPRNPDYVMINYNLCMQNEDLFEEKIEEITLCVKNLISIFTEDISQKTQETWKEDDYMRKINSTTGRKNLYINQNYLMDNFILENIYYLFTYLIDLSFRSMMHYTNQEGQKAQSLIKLAFFNAKIDELYQQKIAPNFYRENFDKVIDSILNLFYLISYNNGYTSVYLLKNFENFYQLIFFFKNRIFNLLKELTSNSIDLDENAKHVILTIFEDFDLPSFKLAYLERNTIKLRFLKSIIKNLQEKRTDENMGVIDYFRRLFLKKLDKLFFIRFQRELGNEIPEIMGNLFLLRAGEERNERVVKKLRDAKKNLGKYLQEKEHGVRSFQKYICFQFPLNSPVGKHSLDKLYRFVKYYIKIKGFLIRNSNIERFSDGNENSGIAAITNRIIQTKNIELDEAKGTILDITAGKGVNHYLMNAMSSFLVEVYLDFDKYNFFLDDHDYTYFCQKIGTLKLESLLSERPLLLMNPSLLENKDEFLESNQIQSEMLEESNYIPPGQTSAGEAYISVQQTKNYYNQLMRNLKLFHETMMNFKEINSKNIFRVIQLMYRITNLLRVLNKFIEIGFPSAIEIKEILKALNVFIHVFLNSVVSEALDGRHLGIQSNEYSKHFSSFTKFMVQTTKALMQINKYRLHLVTMIILKFFHTLSLRKQFDEYSTNAFFEQWLHLFSILNFEDLRSAETSPAIEISSYQKFQMIFRKENEMFRQGGVTNNTKLAEFVNSLRIFIPNLILKNDVDFPIKICGNLMNILFGIINNERLSSSKFKQTIKRSLKQFDEQYYIKELRRNIQTVLEEYQLRPVKIISKLRNTEIIFDDPKLKNIMDLVEFGPDEAKYHKDKLQKHRDLEKIIKSHSGFLKKIEKVNVELTEQYLNKIYFKKMQKMTQISKITEICHLFMKQIFNHITGSLAESYESLHTVGKLNSEIRTLFFQIKRIFILQMKKSKKKPLSDEDMWALKNYCLDVFIPKDLECDDLIIELNQYFDQQSLEQDIKTIFRLIDETDLFFNFDQADIHDKEVLVAKSEEIILACRRINQYTNIIRHLGMYPNLKMANNFRSLIIHYMLQSKIIHKLYEKSFMINFCTQARKNMPLKKKRFANLTRTNSLEGLNERYKNIIKHIGILSKNVLELTAHMMSKTPFCKLVFKSQTKYGELEEILLSKKTPLYLRGVYYRLVFESYYSTNNVNFRKVFKLIRRVVNQDLIHALNYCKNANKFGAFQGIFNIARQRITKDDNEFEKDIFHASHDEIEVEAQYQLKQDLYGEEDDDEEEIASLDDVELVESDMEEAENDPNDFDFGGADNLDTGPQRQNDSISKDVSVYDAETGELTTIWFQDGELIVFLTEKQKNNKIDGFIPFLADLTTYIISNMKNYRPQAQKVKTVMEAFLNNLEEFEKNFPNLKRMFTKEIYEHSKLLLSMTVNHCRKILGSTDMPKNLNNMTLGLSSIRNEHASNQRGESDKPRAFQGYSFIKNVRQTKSHHPRKFSGEPLPLDMIKEVRSTAKFGPDTPYVEEEQTKQDLDETDKEESMIRQMTKWEEKTEQVMNILRYSLMTKRISFSDALKDIFDDELVNMEQKLVGSLVRLIEESVEKKYNFLVVFEDDPKIEISFQDVEKAVRFIKINNSNLQEELATQNIEEELNIGLDNNETIKTIILLNDHLYYRKNNTTDAGVGSDGLGGGNVIRGSISATELARVESLTDIEQTNFLDKINHNMALRSDYIERFLANQSFYMLFLNHAEFNALAIQSLISKRNDYVDILKDQLLLMSVKQHKQIFFKRKIEKILSSQESRFLFLNSTKIMIEEVFELNKNSPDNEEIMTKVQKNLSDKFLGLFCLKMFVSTKENDLIRSESLEILYLMLVHGNEDVQKHMYETIINNYGFINLIETIEMYLKKLDKRIQEKLFEIQNNDKNREDSDSEYFVLKRILGLDAYKLLTNIFRFLQVLTENCHQDFQNIMREQIFFEHNTNNNLIQKIIDVIIGLGEFISFVEPSENQNETGPQENQNKKEDEENELLNQPENEKKSDVVKSESRSPSNGFASTNNIFGTVIENEELKKKKLIFQSKYCKAEFNNKRGEDRKILKGIDLLKSISRMENRKLKSVIHFGLFFLNDVIMGPNKENQKIVLMNSGLIDFAASIIEKLYLPNLKVIDNLDNDEFDYYDYLLFSDAVNLFLFTTSGVLDLNFYEFIFDEYYLRLMDKKVNSIFQKIIVFHKRKLYSGKLSPDVNSLMDNLNKFDVNLSEISILAQRELDQYTLNKIQQGGETNSQQFGLEMKEFINMVLFKVIQASHNMFIYLKRAQSRDKMSVILKNKPYYRFYQEFYGYVEIKHQDQIEIAQFTRPYKTHFHYDRDNLSNDFEIEPQHEKIVNFIERMEMYEDFLDIRQRNYRFNKAAYLSTKHKYLFEVGYYLILILINFVFLYVAVREKDGDLNVTDLDLRLGIFSFSDKLSGLSENLLVAVGLLNILFALCIMILNFPEDIPITKFYWKKVREDYLEQFEGLERKSNKFESLILKSLIWITDTSKTGIGYWLSFQNIYAMFIFGLSVLALFIPFIYPFLLLDIVQRSKTLRNIIRSVSNNYSSLTLTLILTLIIMYIYATISFTFFPDHYEHGPDSDFQNYCYSLATCFFTVINNGLRAGGGLGEAIGQPTIEDSRYILRYIMDLTFMIIILIILLNIVFGIIIDTFGDMRNARDEWLSYLKNTCLLCNLSKSDIDSYGEGYYRHINLSHSLDDYVHFIIYIKNKNINNCDGIEQSVKRKYNEGDYSFMPNQESFYFRKTESEE